MGRMLGRIHPHVWKSGPDIHRHKLFTDCQRARAQAKFRGEEWTIQEDDYADIWMKDDCHLSRGRGANDLCMTRIDWEKPWSIDNVELVNRKEHLVRMGKRRRGITYVRSRL